MRTILVTSVGSAEAAAVCQSLRAHTLVGCDIYPQSWNVNAAAMELFFQAPPATDAPAYLNALRRAAEAYGLTHILPLTDPEVDVLCAEKAAFAARGVTVCVPDAPAARLCRDKLRMAQVLQEAELGRVIPTWTADAIPADAPYPLLLKPQRGRSSQAQVIVRTETELHSALTLRDDYIIQPFLAGDIYCVDAVRDRFGNAAAVVRRELLRTSNGLGTTVEVLPLHPLGELAERILARAGFVGAGNLEFICHEGAYSFLEVNPRFSGGVGFSGLAGYDMIANNLRAHDGEPIQPADGVRAMILAQRYEQRVTELR